MIDKFDFWEQKSRISKPTMKNKVIGTLEETAKKYNISISEAIEKFINKELDYDAEYQEFYNNVIRY